jgi:hypothetical protein
VTEFVTDVEAAELVRVQPITIRQWVLRGYLHPIPGTWPRLFLAADVYDCHHDRKRESELRRLRHAADAWLLGV